MSTDIVIAGCAFIALLGALIGFLINVTVRLAKVELMATTMWDFQVRRSKAEALQKGFAEMNSPFRMKPETLHYLDPIKADLQNLYHQKDWKNDAELALAIEKEYGEKLETLVCMPARIYQGTCLLMAIAVAKGETELFGAA